MSVAWPNFRIGPRSSSRLRTSASTATTTANLTGGDQPERLNAAIASSQIFGALGVGPSAGRTFTPEEDKPGAPRTALISERLWRGRFAADPGIVGRTVVLNNEPHVLSA